VEQQCSVCREVAERSALYERWLFAENHGDGATLGAVAAARGFCTIHASRLLERDADIAAAIAHFVFRVLRAEIDREMETRRGYRHALDPAAPCPWCATEREALEFALGDAARRRGEICRPHTQAARAPADERRAIHSPLRGGAVLEQPAATTEPKAPERRWWANSVTALWESLRSGCPSCAAAREAGTRREAFLRAGPQPQEHWEVPRLCVAHDNALSEPPDSRPSRTAEGPNRPCDWCSVMKRAAEETNALFALAYRVDAFRRSCASVPGLCLPHASQTLHLLPDASRKAFAHDVRARIAALLWELDERALRRSWQLRDQGQLPYSTDLSHRAWWFLAGGVFRDASNAGR
jgi:hypothetical protein